MQTALAFLARCVTDQVPELRRQLESSSSTSAERTHGHESHVRTHKSHVRPPPVADVQPANSSAAFWRSHPGLALADHLVLKVRWPSGAVDSKRHYVVLIDDGRGPRTSSPSCIIWFESESSRLPTGKMDLSGDAVVSLNGSSLTVYPSGGPRSATLEHLQLCASEHMLRIWANAIESRIQSSQQRRSAHGHRRASHFASDERKPIPRAATQAEALARISETVVVEEAARWYDEATVARFGALLDKHTPETLATALMNYEIYFRTVKGSATASELVGSSAGVRGWAECSLDGESVAAWLAAKDGMTPGAVPSATLPTLPWLRPTDEGDGTIVVADGIGQGEEGDGTSEGEGGSGAGGAGAGGEDGACRGDSVEDAELQRGILESARLTGTGRHVTWMTEEEEQVRQALAASKKVIEKDAESSCDMMKSSTDLIEAKEASIAEMKDMLRAIEPAVGICFVGDKGEVLATASSSAGAGALGGGGRVVAEEEVEDPALWGESEEDDDEEDEEDGSSSDKVGKGDQRKAVELCELNVGE